MGIHSNFLRKNPRVTNSINRKAPGLKKPGAFSMSQARASSLLKPAIRKKYFHPRLHDL
jgi:hypothetical protein